MTQELAYILGYSLKRSIKDKSGIEILTKDYSLLQNFQVWLQHTYNYKATITNYDKRKNLYRLYFSISELNSFLKSYGITCDTKSNWVELDKICMGSYIRAVFDTGTPQYYKGILYAIGIGAKDRKKIDKLTEYISLWGIETPTISRRKYSDIYSVKYSSSALSKLHTHIYKYPCMLYSGDMLEAVKRFYEVDRSDKSKVSLCDEGRKAVSEFK